MKYLSTILLFLILIACQDQVEDQEYNETKITLPDFESVKLGGKIINLNSSVQFFDINTIDTLLLLGTSSKHKEYFKAYSLNNYDYLGSIGTRGEAPGQWKFARVEGGLMKDDEHFSIWISDDLAGYLKKINLSKSLTDKANTPTYSEHINVNSNLFPFNSVYKVDNYLIGDTGYEDESYSRFKKMNMETNDIKHVPFFPKLKNFQSLPSPVLYSIYVGAFEKHPNKNLFVSTPSTFNRIDFLDDNLDVYKTIVDGENWKDNYYDAKEIDIASDQTYEMQDGHFSTSVTKNYIFTRYRNISKELDGRQNKEEAMIKVFDWEGNPIKLLYLDCDAFTFSYNEMLKTLFVVDIENEQILTYDLNGVLP